jgi:hypothetical protein
MTVQLKDLFQIEDAVESAVSQFLEASEIPADLLNSKDLLKTPRVEVVLQVGAVTGHRAFYNAKVVHDAWEGILIFRVVTNRQKNGELHKQILGLIRYLIQPAFGNFNLANLPLHSVSVVSEAGTTLKTEDEPGRDISEMHVKVIVSIRTTAWSQLA